MKTKLIRVLREEEDRVCEAWTKRLSDTASLAGKMMIRRPTSAVRSLLHDVVLLLEDKAPLSHEDPLPALKRRAEAMPDWRINLSQAVELLLTGEVVVRAWVVTHVDATEREQLEMFEQINRVFHQLIRLHTLHYCHQCRSALPTSG